MDFSKYQDNAVELIMVYGPKVLLAVVTLLIGLWIIKALTRMTGRALERSRTDVSLTKFLVSLLSIVLKVMLVITVAAMIGVETTSFIAVLGAAGLAVGLALQGSLSNFAGGVLIMLFKPYQVGDFVEAQGVKGTVNSIQIFNTILKTPDNKTVIVPNGDISNGVITNYSTEPTRRIDLVFGIGYDDDIKKARDVINAVISQDERILKEPEPMIVVSELGDSSVNFTVRVWCNSGDYWSIYFDMHEIVKIRFDDNDISIPYPQRDVHVFNTAS